MPASEQQRLILRLLKTAMAVIIDAGEWKDIHPLNKYALGYRLALAAQSIAYDNSHIVYSGPEINSLEEKDGTLLLSFKHIGAGLVAKGGGLQEFAITGEDGKFVWAKVKIIGNQIKHIKQQDLPASSFEASVYKRQ